MAAGISGRRKVQAALAEARRLLAELEKAPPAGAPQHSAPACQRVIDVLARGREHIAEAPESKADLDDLMQTSQERYERVAAAEPFLARSDAARQAGDWATAAAQLSQARERLGDLAGAGVEQRLAKYHDTTAAVDTVLTAAGTRWHRLRNSTISPRDGDLAAVQWAELDTALAAAADALAPRPEGVDPLPPNWGELLARVEDLARRARVLQQAREKVAAGRGVDAVPMLQAVLAQGPDPILNSVLRRLVRSSAGAASEQAHARLASAETHLRAGELEEAAARRWPERGHMKRSRRK